MAKFPSFHGATVEVLDSPEGTFRIRSVLPCPGAPNDRVIVTSGASADIDPQIVYEINKRDALVEAANNCAPADKEQWQKRANEANKVVRKGQILRPFAAGLMKPEEAAGRLAASGFTFAESAPLIDEHMAAHQTAYAAILNATAQAAEDGE